LLNEGGESLRESLAETLEQSLGRWGESLVRAHDEALARQVADRVDRMAAGQVVQGTSQGAAS
jgi:ABC-type sulfate/molybdate transport systems ATPase subunit